MQEMRVGIKTGFWFRVLKSEKSEETVHMGRQPVGESKSRRVKRVLVSMVALHEVWEPEQGKEGLPVGAEKKEQGGTGIPFGVTM